MPSPPDIHSLPSDVLCRIIELVGRGNYRYVAAASRGLRNAYTRCYPKDFYTSDESVVGSEKTAELYASETRSASACTNNPNKRQKVDNLDRIAEWACRYGRLHVLKWAVRQTKRQGRWSPHSYCASTCRDEAAKGGHIGCFEYLIDPDAYLQRNYEDAAQNGHLPFLRHFHEKQNGGLTVYTTLCSKAAISGHLHVLRFLHETARCEWDSNTCSIAASHGHLDCLKYLHENGCPWNLQDINRRHITCEAAQGGLSCLTYVHEQGCVLSKYAYEKAALAGHLDCLAYLYEQGTDMHRRGRVAMTYAARYGHLDCLKYMLEINGNAVPSNALVNAAGGGHADCLKYMLEINGNAVPSNALVNAAGGGHADCLAYLIEDTIGWKRSKLNRALIQSAKLGRMDCLVYLIETDRVTWSESEMEIALMNAAMKGRLACLRYLVEPETYRWRNKSLETAVEVAVYYGNKDCVLQLLEVENVNWDRGRLRCIIKYFTTGPMSSSSISQECVDVLEEFVQFSADENND